MPSCTAKERFPTLTDDEFKSLTKYYQKNLKAIDMAAESVLGDSQMADGTFSTSAPAMGTGDGAPVEFIKIIERWDRRDFMVKTVVEGLKRWAIEPYPPPQASTRFYPFFYLAFFPVEGKRHPQSLSWRLRKLQDEYSSCRSNQRLVRERSVTGVIFNGAAIDPADARKITDANQQELIEVRAAAGEPLANLFIAKPVGTYNPQLYDTQPIGPIWSQSPRVSRKHSSRTQPRAEAASRRQLRKRRLNSRGSPAGQAPTATRSKKRSQT